MDAISLISAGDSRRIIIETILDLRSGKMAAATGIAIAANMKVLNESIFAEIAAAKLCLQTEGHAHSFGRVVGMGQRLIGNGSGQDA